MLVHYITDIPYLTDLTVKPDDILVAIILLLDTGSRFWLCAIGGLQLREAYLCLMPVTKSRLQKETGSLLATKEIPQQVDFRNLYGVHTCHAISLNNV